MAESAARALGDSSGWRPSPPVDFAGCSSACGPCSDKVITRVVVKGDHLCPRTVSGLQA